MKRPVLVLAPVLACTLGAAAEAAQINLSVATVGGLYQAFMTADANPSNLYIIQLSPGTYSLRCPSPGDTMPASGALKLTRGKVRLNGAFGDENAAASYVLDGGWGSSSCSSSFFKVAASGPSATVFPSLDVSGLTLQNARSDAGLQPVQVQYGTFNLSYSHMHHTESLADGALGGGGIYALDSKISILRSYLEDAATEDAAEIGQCGNGQFGWGGEIDYVDDGVMSNQSRSLTIVQSSIRGAAGCRGGAIVYNSTARSSLVIQNSTIAQNIGVISGGGLYLVGRGSVNLMGNTIASNTAATSTSDGSPINRVGGGIAFDGFTGSLTMQGNIVAQNVAQFSKRTDGTSIPDSNDCYILGAFASSRTTSFNLVGKQGNCSFLPVGPLVGTATAPVDPRLGTFEGFLGMYGWSGFLAMFTGLQPGSAAITGNGGTCLSADEREFSRTSTGCDIGAYQTSCLHDPCKAGPNLVPDCGDCVARICDVDPFCCASLWDPICVGEVSSVCGLTCQ